MDSWKDWMRFTSTEQRPQRTKTIINVCAEGHAPVFSEFLIIINDKCYDLKFREMFSELEENVAVGEWNKNRILSGL